MCCTVLQFVREGFGSRSCANECHMCVAVCCSVWNVRCSVLQHVKRYVTVRCNMSIVCCGVLQYVAMRSSVLRSVKRALQCVAVCYIMLQCVTVRCRGFLLPLLRKKRYDKHCNVLHIRIYTHTNVSANMMTYTCVYIHMYVYIYRYMYKNVKDVLQCAIVWCNVLQCVTVRCRGFLLPLLSHKSYVNRAMQCAALSRSVRCSVLHYVAVCVALCCCVLRKVSSPVFT